MCFKAPLRPLCLFAISLLFATSCVLRAACVDYPALGNVDLDEGTIEIWLTPLASLAPEKEEAKWKALFQFLEFSAPGAFSCSVTWTQNRDKARFRVRCESANGAMLPLSLDEQADPGWVEGRPARMALVWKDRWMGFYVDGKLFGERMQNAALKGNMNDVVIRLGNSKKSCRPWLLQAIRISSVARPVDQLEEKPSGADAATLLFDVPEDWKKGQEQPRVIALIDGQPQAAKIDGASKTPSNPAGVVVE